MKLRLAPILLAFFCASCTPGASGAGGAPTTGAAKTIDVSLTAFAAAQTSAGAGYSPLMLTVPVGTTLRFVNTDGFAHTATKIGGTSFPGPYPFTSGALTQTGSALSGAWSTGALNAGAASQTFIADQPGTYIFGCFFHYEAPMRGVIIVQ
ncbi:MAG TPA: plastocyanin/azurin family copper-binding protein [Candidatus Acidoferrales bacterium]|nr:plastocyanin/azurin family copper-binding protein [Candidatus Acidoferrales bacterium]